MAATHTIYQTPAGKNENGYIIDGKTYKDPYGRERIEIGSTVPTAGGTYTYTAAGSVLTPTSIAEQTKKYYDAGRQNLANGLSAKTDAINAATGNTIANINDQKKTAERQYADANRQAYRSYLSAANPYGAAGEQRARLGLANSGYAESSNMKIANEYQNTLGENYRQKQDYLNELERARREAQYQGDIQKANAIAEYELLVYRHGINEAETIANQQNRAYEAGIAANEALWNRQAQNRAYEDAREDELWQRAYKLANMGLSNAEIARSLGISREDLNALIRRLLG